MESQTEILILTNFTSLVIFNYLPSRLSSWLSFLLWKCMPVIIFFNNHRTLKTFRLVRNYQANTTRIWIFETSLFPDCVYQIINFTKNKVRKGSLAGSILKSTIIIILSYFDIKISKSLLISFKGTVMQNGKALINDRLLFSNVSWKFHIPTI